MPVEFIQAEPMEVREAVVSALWRKKRWPWETLADYYRYWDWRYTSLSDGETRVWVARDEGEVRGHIALHERRFRIGNRDIRVGVPANFWVEEEYRGGFTGPRFAAAIRDAVRRGCVDMALGFANDAAHAMLVRLGFVDAGPMKSYRDVVRSQPLVRRRLPALAKPVSGVLDIAFSARRRFKGDGVAEAGQELEVVPLTAADLRTLDRSHWEYPPDRFVEAGRGEYLAARFLECPFEDRKAFGLVEPSSRRVQAFVIVEGENRVKVWNCQVNHGRLEPAAAIRRVAETLPDLAVMDVPVLPTSRLADGLTAAGFWPTRGDEVVQRTRISGFCRDDHPMAPLLTAPDRWDLWAGTSHH